MMVVIKILFLVFLTHACLSTTTQRFQYVNVRLIANSRLDVTPRDVVAYSSPVKCSAVCRLTSWCVSVNVAPDRSTCQLLPVEESDVALLESADSWLYLRESANSWLYLRESANSWL